ncbi:MAG: hypothetical protein K0S71_2568 [Clostridia bacterium]|jgi:hypothetical protein|nr:hypothetical protein [Clostridia bacterium]
MNDKKAEPVRGENNKRLYSDDPIKNEGTAAWAHTERLMDETQVNVPSERNVINAKEWVDNGSRL